MISIEVQATPPPRTDSTRPAARTGHPSANARPARRAIVRWQQRSKRAIDMLVAPISLVLYAPVAAVAAIAIRLDTPGPIIFRQTRVGADGEPFVMLKLRTMTIGGDDSHHREYVASMLNGHSEQVGGLYKLTDDVRITRVGRILRSLSIDEIPQLLNILRGDMTLVGPRPALPSEVELYDEHQLRRLAGRPGITGLWQVSGRCELGYREMIDLDVEYLDNWSLWLDLKILARTPLAVLSRRGAA